MNRDSFIVCTQPYTNLLEVQVCLQPENGLLCTRFATPEVSEALHNFTGFGSNFPALTKVGGAFCRDVESNSISSLLDFQ